MQPLERPSFETETERLVYRYVDRHGRADPDRLADALGLPAGAVEDALAGLMEAGYIHRSGGSLRLALDLGAPREHEDDGLAYTVRPAREEDADELVDVILRDVTATEKYVVAESLGESILYEGTVLRCTPVESRILFVATVGDEIVGWVNLDLPQVERLRGTGRMTLGVREAYRSRGIGERLHATGLNWAETNDCRHLFVHVPAINERGVEFLTDRGWAVAAVREGHYEIDGDPVDEVLLRYAF